MDINDIEKQIEAQLIDMHKNDKINFLFSKASKIGLKEEEKEELKILLGLTHQ